MGLWVSAPVSALRGALAVVLALAGHVALDYARKRLRKTIRWIIS